MLKVKFDWSKKKFQAAASATGPSGIREKQPQLSLVPETATSSSTAASAAKGMSQTNIVNGGPPPSFLLGSNYDEEGNQPRASFGGVGSAFSSTGLGNSASSVQYCCLTEDGQRCPRPAGNASYSKRIQKTVQQKRLRLTIDNSARHIYICDHHKNMIQSVRTTTKRKRKDSGDDDNSNDAFGYNAYDNSRDPTSGEGPQVDLGILQVKTLRRYQKLHRIQARQGNNKSALVEQVMRHFRTLPVIEKEAITYFIYMVKTNRNKLDQTKGNVLLTEAQ